VSYTVKDARLSQVRVALNGLAPWPCRVPRIESALEGRSADQVQAHHIDDAISASFTPRDGLRATWAYRSLVTRNLVLSFLQPHVEESLS
jgi:xanthine dehydrogenase small subunit